MPSKEIQSFEDAQPTKWMRLLDSVEDTVIWIYHNAHNDYVRDQMLRAVYYNMFGEDPEA